MPVFILLPVLALAALQWGWPAHALFTALPFPETPFVALFLVAGVAALMRQWHWMVWLALLGGHYWAVLLGLQQPMSEPNVAALFFVLPLLLTLVMLLLAVMPLPHAVSVPGVLLVFTCFFLPIALVEAPLAHWLAVANIPDFFFARPVTATYLAWGQIWWFSAFLFLWLGLVSFRSQRAVVWGQFGVWLAIILFYVMLDRPSASGWVVLAACLTLLITLAYEMLRLAYVDELTQLPQRRALERHLKHLGRRSAVCMLDVDHFKQFNDTWGHEVGDQVLRLLGSILADLRGVSSYRYGGEEFTLVFNHNREDAIREKLEEARERVANYPLALRRADNRPEDVRQGKAKRGKGGGPKTVHITISLGCAVRQSGDTPESLLKRADEALYGAKQAGRNQVKMAS